MDDISDYDVYVIGAGPAGSAAAWQLAKEGVSVALIDRGSPVGSKNLSGGVLWGHDLALLEPEWWEKAPVERPIVSKKIGMINETKSLVLDWFFEEWGDEPYIGFSILRAGFDQWMAKKAKDAGADIYEGINVEKLWIEKGQVKGLIQEGDHFSSKAVIVADGANSRILINSGLTTVPFEKRHFYLGIKEVLGMPSDDIEKRFDLNPGEGAAFEFLLGGLPSGIVSGGFLYTNKKSISLGIVVELDTLPPNVHSYDILEYFKQHPRIQRYIGDAELLEYAAHFVPAGGIHMMPPLFGDGYVVVGDAAGFCFSNGLVINGNGPAIRSGIEAGKAVGNAVKQGNTSAKMLQSYQKNLMDTYVLQNLIKFKNVEAFKANPRLYAEYTDYILSTSEILLREENKPRKHILETARQNMKRMKLGLVSTIRDFLQVRQL